MTMPSISNCTASCSHTGHQDKELSFSKTFVGGGGCGGAGAEGRRGAVKGGVVDVTARPEHV